jgi:putative acetyltransferase
LNSNLSKIRIRLAERDDAAAIASVLSESFVEYEPLYTPAGFAATTPNAEEIHLRMEEGPTWVAVSDDAIIGTVSVVPRGESLYIRGMAVLPVARGQHIGELFLSHVRNFAALQSYKRLFLSTTPFLNSAIRVYERFGFQRTAEGPHDLFGTPLFTMQKSVRSK